MKTELIIDDLGSEGDGIAHSDNRTIFVSGALSGELVLAEVTGQQAKLLSVLTPSPDRVQPPCAVYDRCGGCRIQHLEMSAYKAWKYKSLSTLFEKSGLGDVDLKPLLTSIPATRRRARFTVRRQGHDLRLGFNAWKSHDIIHLPPCLVLRPEISALLPKLKVALDAWLPKNRDEGDIQITLLPHGFDLLLIGGGPLSLDLRQDLAAFAEEQDIAQTSWRKNDRAEVEPISHRRPLSVNFGDISVPFPPGSFLQATSEGEAALLSFARNAIGPGAKAFDLFSGLGGFGLSLNAPQKLVFADSDSPAIARLSRALGTQGQRQTLCRDLLREPITTTELGSATAIVFDPPRGGAKRQAEEIALSNAPIVVAISCDPSSFVRDAKILVSGGYKLGTVQPVDQFLWSSHLELGAVFTKDR